MISTAAPPAHQSFSQLLDDLWSDRLARREGYVQVPTALFVSRIDINMPAIPAMDIFIEQNGGAFSLLKRAEQPYSPLALSVYPHVWIKEKDLGPIKLHAEDRALSKERVTAGATPAEQRMQDLRKVAMRVVDDLFKNPTAENVQRSTKVVSSFVYLMMKDPSAYLVLSQLSSHDPYTLQHSVGVSVACIILGKKLGITNERELAELGLAGLFHDIGKVTVDKEIINKNGPLSETEWEEMRGHSQAGYDMIKNNPLLSARTKRAVLEHHEDKNGTGYPSGLTEEKIDLWARIVCICDIFNALTTDRTYSKAKTAFEAFQFMRDQLHHKMDDRIFRELVLIYGGKLK